MRTILTDRIGDLVADFVGQTFGSTKVTGAVGWLDEGSDGEVLVRVSLTLSDPADDTWPDDDLFEMRSAFRTRAAELQMPIAFDFRPVTNEELSDDEGEAGDGEQ